MTVLVTEFRWFHVGLCHLTQQLEEAVPRVKVTKARTRARAKTRWMMDLLLPQTLMRDCCMMLTRWGYRPLIEW